MGLISHGAREPTARANGIASYVPLACTVFSAALVALGLVHVIFGETVMRMLPEWPEGLPGRPWWAHGMGVAMAVAAGAMLGGRNRRKAALLLAAIVVLPVLALHVPRSIPTGELGNAWLRVLKWSAMAAAPLAVAAHLPTSGAAPRRDRIVALGAAAAPWLLAAFMLVSAILHIRYAEFVAQLMQPWMPWRTFWTYFAAVALAAGAIGLVVPWTTRIAAMATSLMIFLWFFLVHIPRMLIDPTGPVGWSEMAESLAFSALAFLLAVPAPAPKAAMDPDSTEVAALDR